MARRQRRTAPKPAYGSFRDQTGAYGIASKLMRSFINQLGDPRSEGVCSRHRGSGRCPTVDHTPLRLWQPRIICSRHRSQCVSRSCKIKIIPSERREFQQGRLRATGHLKFVRRLGESHVLGRPLLIILAKIRCERIDAEEEDKGEHPWNHHWTGFTDL